MPRWFLGRAGVDPDADFAGPPGYSASHDATCIKEYIARSLRGDAGTMKRMLIARTAIPRPSGSAHVGMVTCTELGKRTFKPNGACAMNPL